MGLQLRAGLGRLQGEKSGAWAMNLQPRLLPLLEDFHFILEMRGRWVAEEYFWLRSIVLDCLRKMSVRVSGSWFLLPLESFCKQPCLFTQALPSSRSEEKESSRKGDHIWGTVLQHKCKEKAEEFKGVVKLNVKWSKYKASKQTFCFNFFSSFNNFTFYVQFFATDSFTVQ